MTMTVGVRRMRWIGVLGIGRVLVRKERRLVLGGRDWAGGDVRTRKELAWRKLLLEVGRRLLLLLLEREGHVWVELSWGGGMGGREGEVGRWRHRKK
jgi:hypothetical protein